MKPHSIMVIAGEPSGDLLAAEVVNSLRAILTVRDASPSEYSQPLRASLAPRFFGAGGPRMAEAGVELAFDMTQHAVVGLAEVFRNLGKFRQLFRKLLTLALQRQPDAILMVDFSGFNRRFATAVRAQQRSGRGLFNNWEPKLVQYISPQVWASRESRVRSMARDLDLLLAIFPFEKDWYALRAPGLRVEFVGHPMLDRFPEGRTGSGGAVDADSSGARPSSTLHPPSSPPLVLLLPGSRPVELSRHLPVMLAAAGRMRQAGPDMEFRMVLPNEDLAAQASNAAPASLPLHIQIGGLAESLGEARLAIASTGTVTMECAYFGVPTVALYRTSWSTFQIARRIVNVAFLAMPNLLAGEAIFPELIQDAATPENIAREGLDLLGNSARREWIQRRLEKVITALGGPGASRRAAEVIAELLQTCPALWK